MSFWAVVIGLAVVAIASAVFWVLAPQKDRTVWRSTVILTLAMVYLLWAITYLAQLHPLVQPRRSDLRPEFAD
jgi:hypothetical protein